MSSSRVSSHRSSPVKSGKSTRSKSSKSVKASRSSSAAVSSGTSDGGKKAGAITELIDENGMLHLDMNNQGLTVLAPSLFDKSKLVTLDLGCNNLQKISPLVCKLRSLTRLCVSKNSIRCINPSDYSGFPREMSTLVNLEELDVSECNFPHVPPVIWDLRNLKVLNISRNKINMLVPEVGNLVKLQHLNAQLTNICTLPPEIAFCQDLKVLLLFGNVIDSLPETLCELQNLHTFAINYKSFCSVFDTYMDNLLQKGQIQSEHIPAVVFEIPSLRALNLEATKINTLPDRCDARLEEFYLQKNFLMRVPSIVPNVLNLKILDMSNNFIKSLPEELSQLTALEVFRVDNNQIKVIPTSFSNLVSLTLLSMGGNMIEVIPPQIANLSKLKSLILNRNKITAMPESIIELTKLETLDLTSNKITSLPICFYKMESLVKAHQYNKLTKAGLWLHQNPITVPPEEIWKTENPNKIYTYLNKLEIKQTKNLQQQKLIVIGDEQSGKTSLVNTMITKKSSLTNGVRDSTRIAEYKMWKTDNNVSFMVLDLGGHNVYKTMHSMFLDQTSMYMLVYDHQRYTADTHDAALGCWLSLLHIHAPGAIVKLIGSHADNISEEISEVTMKIVTEKVNEQLLEISIQLKKEIEQIDAILETDEKPAEILIHLKKQRLRMETLKKKPLRIHGDIKLISCEEGTPGVTELVEEMEYLAIDKQLRPRAQCFIPENWLNYRRALKLQNDHCLNWEQVERLAKESNIDNKDIIKCLHFFSEIGDLLWFENIPELKTTIFHKPRKLVQTLSGLFRHDMETFLNFSENRIFASRGQFSAETFAVAKEALQLCGQVSRPMMQCLWFYLYLDYENFNFLCELIPKLEVCYLIPQPEIPVRKTKFSQLIVIPSYNSDPHPDDYIDTELWPQLPKDEQIELKVVFSFPIHQPQGLFERLANRVQNLVSNRCDWQDLIWAEAEDDGNTMTQLLLLRSFDHSDQMPFFSLATRSAVLGEASRLLKSLCANACMLLESQPGMVYYIDFSAVNCKDVTVVDCLPVEILER